MPEEFDLKIKEIIPRADKVKSFRLEKAAGRHFKAGQFLCARLKIEAECKRYLSISSSPTEAGYIEFTKKITGSVFSKTLDGLRPGDSLIIQYPFGKFTLQDADKKIAFLSGGIGVTPIRSICKDAVDRKTGVDIVVIYANRSLMDIIFREDFDGMQQAGAKLRVVHVLCEPAPDFRCVPGLINARVIRDEVPDYAQRKFFICGPPGMVEAMQGTLKHELLIEKKNIVTENFEGY